MIYRSVSHTSYVLISTVHGQLCYYCMPHVHVMIYSMLSC